MIRTSVIEYIKKNKDSWSSLREEFHSLPEFSLQEYNTINKIKNFLLKYGIEVIEFEGHGIVGVIKHGNGSNKIALKASIDGVEQIEETNLSYKSNNNCMHANGNDGHIVMLLGTCQYLSETRDFNGTFYAIFSGGQNSCNGIDKLIEKDLFNKINPDSVFSLRSMPLSYLKEGKAGNFHFYDDTNNLSVHSSSFEFTIFGKSSYGGIYDNGYDPIVAAAAIIMNLQTIISRNISPFNNAAINVGTIKGGYTPNTIAKSIRIKLSTTANDERLLEYLIKRVDSVFENSCAAYNCTFNKRIIENNVSFKNNQNENLFAKSIAISLFEEDKVFTTNQPMCSDDFVSLLNKKPGALVLINNGTSEDIYSNKYDFNNQIIPFGVCFLIELVEKKLQ